MRVSQRRTAGRRYWVRDASQRIPMVAARRLNIVFNFAEALWYLSGRTTRFLTPEECTRLDFEEISTCDVFIPFPGAPASPGTHVEIGWVSAVGKPTVLLEEAGRRTRS